MSLPAGVVLRPAESTDAEAGAALHIACWREAYGPHVDAVRLRERLADTDRFVDAWTRQLAQGPPRVLAQAGDELVGFAVVGTSRDEDRATPAELFALYSRSAWWGSGLGQALWNAVAPDEACSLWVLEANERAQAFYRRNGFTADGARERYDHLDAWEVRMVRR